MSIKSLAIDTSSDYMSLAVLEDEKVLASFHRRAHMAHSRLLVPMIDRILKKARVRIKEIDLFSVSIGPGSFTGLRIGSTVTKGFSFALSKPIAAVPTFDAIARNVKGYIGVICTVLDARKGKVYACIYRSDGRTLKRLSGYLLIPAEDLMKRLVKYGRIYFLGDTLPLIGKEASGIDWHPKAGEIGRLGLELYKRGKTMTPEDLEPFYIYSRECDITGK